MTKDLTGVIRALTVEVKVMNDIYKDRMEVDERREARMWKLLWALFVVITVLAGVNVLGLAGVFTP